MNDGIEKLIQTLERAVAGDSMDGVDVRKLRFESSDHELHKCAIESYRRLLHFADDFDIRSIDPDYDRQMKGELEWRARGLADQLARANSVP